MSLCGGRAGRQAVQAQAGTHPATLAPRCSLSPAGAGDETLRFWNVFPGPKMQGTGSDAGMGSMMRTLIR